MQHPSTPSRLQLEIVQTESAVMCGTTRGVLSENNVLTDIALEGSTTTAMLRPSKVKAKERNGFNQQKAKEKGKGKVNQLHLVHSLPKESAIAVRIVSSLTKRRMRRRERAATRFPAQSPSGV